MNFPLTDNFWLRDGHDLWRCGAVRTAVLGHQEQRDDQGVLALRLPRPYRRKHSQDPFLVRHKKLYGKFLISVLHNIMSITCN